MSDQAAIGMVDIEMLTPGGDPGINRLSAPECSGLKKTALSNSLIDLTDGTYEYVIVWCIRNKHLPQGGFSF